MLQIKFTNEFMNLLFQTKILQLSAVFVASSRPILKQRS